MIVGMQEGIEAIKLKKCTYGTGRKNLPAKVIYMSSGARIFGDGVGFISIKVENMTEVNVDELQEEMTGVVSKFGFKIVATDVSSYAEAGTCWFTFSIKYHGNEE